jgi:hypothetical protein
MLKRHMWQLNAGQRSISADWSTECPFGGGTRPTQNERRPRLITKEETRLGMHLGWSGAGGGAADRMGRGAEADGRGRLGRGR